MLKFFFVAVLVVGLGAFALLFPQSSFGAEFSLQAPTDGATRDVSDDPFVWDHFNAPGLDYYKIQLRKVGGSWVNENVPLSFCSGATCEITPISFSVVTLEFSDRYDWKVIAYNAGDAPIGTSQQWVFFTESAPGPIQPPPDGTTPSPTFSIENPISSKTLPELLGNVLNFLFGLAIIILPIVIIYAGILMVTARGDPEKLSLSRTILLWAVIAFAIILLARGLPTVLRGLL